MHYDEFWPNYRGAGLGGGRGQEGLFGREVRSHTAEGCKWLNVKFESRRCVMSAIKRGEKIAATV